MQRLQPGPYDSPPQYHARVRAYNAAVNLLQQDRLQLIATQNQVLGELNSIRSTAANALARMKQAFAENQQAHQRALDGCVFRYNSTVDATNVVIRTYNEKLQSLGRLLHSAPCAH